MPSLRMDQSELKCKNGCDYFGNPQWQGYCSTCHREQIQRQRRQAAASSSATLPKPDRKPDRAKVASHSSFSKFEEKRLRQSETLRKANLLKFSVFKKANNEEQERESSERPSELKIPPQVWERLRREFRDSFPHLAAPASAPARPSLEGDVRKLVLSLIHDVIKCSSTMSVDELSERVQRHYQRAMRHLETAPQCAAADADTRERLLDLIEKHAMTYLYQVAGAVFPPAGAGADDERADAAMAARVAALRWLGPARLDCRLPEPPPAPPTHLHLAIAELLSMERARWPGGKLAHVTRACRLAGQAAGAAASADELLPALILTVLKANPPRLVSNINYVTRFCNAQRLMTGEGGYCFTNLCCAVSFIENLTPESLGMTPEHFADCMALPGPVGGHCWAAALSLCAEQHEGQQQAAARAELREAVTRVERASGEHLATTQRLQEEITKKVQDVLAKTPLEVKPRKELPRFGKFRQIKSAPLIDLGSTSNNNNEERENAQNTVVNETLAAVQASEVQETNLEKPESISQTPETKESTTPDQERPWKMPQATPLELLSPSPLELTFGTQSMEELLSPEEFAVDQTGLSNIHYDIDLSDFSGDNSIAEDVPPKIVHKDPFSPELTKSTFDLSSRHDQPRDPFSPIMESFDQFNLIDTRSDTQLRAATPRANDPFSPVGLTRSENTLPNKPLLDNRDPFSPVTPSGTEASSSCVSNVSKSILDDNESSTLACLLPSPLVPHTSDGKGT